MADFDFNESRRARVDVARGAVADDIPLLDYTNDDTTGGGAETSFIDPPEDVWEAQNEMPSWAASSVPSGAQHTNALVDRWQIERGEVQQNLEFASSTKGDLWLKWGKKWLLITNKNKPGEFLAPSTIKRYRVDVAKALGVYKSTNLSPQDDAVLKKTDQQVGEAASDIETAPLEDLGQTIIKVEAAVQTAGNIFAVPERPGVPPMTQREFLGICRALETIRGEHTNNLAKLTELDKDIAEERSKLEAASDETTKNIIAERLRNLQDDRAARLEAASSTREALRCQFSRIRETLHRILHEDKTLAERIKTLFREQGITIVSILTALGMIISTIVLALPGGSGGGAAPPQPPQPPGKGGVKEWLKNISKASEESWPSWLARRPPPCQELSGRSSPGSCPSSGKPQSGWLEICGPFFWLSGAYCLWRHASGFYPRNQRRPRPTAIPPTMRAVFSSSWAS